MFLKLTLWGYGLQSPLKYSVSLPLCFEWIKHSLHTKNDKIWLCECSTWQLITNWHLLIVEAHANSSRTFSLLRTIMYIVININPTHCVAIRANEMRLREVTYSILCFHREYQIPYNYKYKPFIKEADRLAK